MSEDRPDQSQPAQESSKLRAAIEDLFRRAGKPVDAKLAAASIEGKQVTGLPRYTLTRGKVAVEDGDVKAEPGHGEFVPRPPTRPSTRPCPPGRDSRRRAK